ncbi:MAG: hypothetical protein AAFX93_10555 [Verrucomicrobiota bacterium]
MKILKIGMIVGTAVLVPFALYLHPRLSDDKELIFESKEFQEVKLNEALLTASRNKEIELTNELESEIRAVFANPDTLNLSLAVSIMARILSADNHVPFDLRDKDHLYKILVESLQLEVYQMQYFFDEQSLQEVYGIAYNSDITVRCLFYVLEAFSFQKKKTLNRYWELMLDFEKTREPHFRIPFEVSDFEHPNVFGDFCLAYSVPAISRLTENIEKIGIEQGEIGNSDHTPVVPPSVPSD